MIYTHNFFRNICKRAKGLNLGYVLVVLTERFYVDKINILFIFAKKKTIINFIRQNYEAESLSLIRLYLLN
ncbi:hypothetical protein YN1HA_21090 [Sulfurisphaera ohwakuensis]